nr:hypothetical protein [Tanacetum cinerariifolium]
MPNIDIPRVMDTSDSPRRQETIRGTPAQTRSERVLEQPNEPPLSEVVYHKALITLTKRVKKLETQLKQKRSRAVIHSSDNEEPSLDIKDSPKQGRMIREIDKDENINLVSKRAEVHETVEPLKDDDDATLTKTLLNIKRSTTKDKDKQTKEEVEAQADTDQEVEEMKLYVKILPDEDISIDAIPLATEPLMIVKYIIVKEGKIGTYHIIRGVGSTKRYTSMIKLLENIDRDDLKTL